MCTPFVLAISLLGNYPTARVAQWPMVDVHFGYCFSWQKTRNDLNTDHVGAGKMDYGASSCKEHQASIDKSPYALMWKKLLETMTAKSKKHNSTYNMTLSCRC